jgi:hypothetical protein
VSVLPLPQAADHERVRNEQIIGDKRPRDARGCDDDLLAQAAASDEPMTSPDNAAHTVHVRHCVPGSRRSWCFCSVSNQLTAAS